MNNEKALREKSRYKPIVYITGLTAALAGLLFGLDIGVISGALPFIGEEFGASILQREDIVSALLWGATFGALISGYFTKKYGRKHTLLLSAVIFAIGSLGCSVAPSADILISARLVLGIAVGIASFTAPLYLSEIAPKSIRGSMISMYQLLITIGIVFAFSSDTYFATYAHMFGHVGGHWRMMLGVLVAPSIIMFIAIYFLPESPRWLLMKGRKSEANNVLSTVRNTEAEILSEMDEIEATLEAKQDGFKLFTGNRNYRKVIFLGVGLQIIQQLTGINIVMYYAPKIFEIAGFGSVSEQMWGTVLVGCVNVFATFIAIAFVDKIGRKPIMYAGFGIMGISMCMVGIIFKTGLDSHPAINSVSTVYPHHVMTFAAIAFLLFFIVGFAMSAGPIIWVICSEIYPLGGRDLGITASTATNWIVNGIVAMTFLSLLEHFGHGNTFLLYGLLEIIFIIVFLLYVPETKGISLEKIEENLMSGRRLKDIGR